jgi:hypothetical protein
MSLHLWWPGGGVLSERARDPTRWVAYVGARGTGDLVGRNTPGGLNRLWRGAAIDDTLALLQYDLVSEADLTAPRGRHDELDCRAQPQDR